MLMTAEQAHETMLDCINYCNEPDVYIEKQITESAYSGKSEYIYDDMLPLYLKDILEMRGYTINEEWYEDGYHESDYVIHDNTVDAGFCDRGVRDENEGNIYAEIR